MAFGWPFGMTAPAAPERLFGVRVRWWSGYGGPARRLGGAAARGGGGGCGGGGGRPGHREGLAGLAVGVRAAELGFQQVHGLEEGLLLAGGELVKHARERARGAIQPL